MKQLIILFILLRLLTVQLFGQCKNADFNTETFWGWTAYSGYRIGDVLPGNHPSLPPGEVEFVPFPSPLVSGTPPLPPPGGPTTHAIMSSAGGPVYDTYTCGTVTTTPPGKTTSARLGDDNIGGHYDMLEYTVSVSPSNNLLLYSFAAIFEDPSVNVHPKEERPTFIVNIIEKSTGNLLSSVNPDCATDTFWANQNDPLLRMCPNISPSGEDVFYRGWTTTGIDLRPYENLPTPNNEIMLQFITYDCSKTGHMGYAYVSAACDVLEIKTQYCLNSDQATLTAPEGFNYLWSNGATSQVITLLNPIPGQTITVDLITKDGCISSISTVLEPSSVTANYNFNDACLGDTVFFTNTSTAADASGSPLNFDEFTWDFGDGSPKEYLQNPIHVYSTPGTYEVSLIAESELGCLDTIIKEVDIFPMPIPDFVVPIVCINSPAFFNDTSSISVGSISSWLWNFDDSLSSSNTSTVPNPTHTFDSSGVYDVQLVVSTVFGCSDTLILPVNVYDEPLASFSVMNNCEGQDVLFSDSSQANSGSIQSWLWNFGDGAMSISQNPQHPFGASVDYDINLYVANSFGCHDDTTITITILSPEVDFSTDTACHGQPTDFFDQSVGNIVAWDWDFGGGLTDTSQYPTIVFDLPGSHVVSLEVTTAEGCKKKLTENIFVFDKPFINFTANIYEGCPELCVQFSDFTTCVDGIDQWIWSIDSNFYNIQNPEHCFTDSGYKDVYLVAISGEGCRDTLIKNDLIDVYDHPTAEYSFSPIEVYVNSPEVSFFNESTNATSYLWTFDFLGTTTAFDTVMEFPYDTAYRYNVCLKAIAANGCEDTVCKTVPVLSIFDFLAANSFTPNHDGLNDYFKPVIIGSDYNHYEFFVYTRWGEVIFHTTNFADEWDGKDDGELVKEDVYVWEVKTRELGTGEYRNFYGHVIPLIFKRGE